MNRLVYVVKRLILGIPVLWIGLTVTFMVLYLGPFSPVLSILGKDADPAAVHQLKVQLNLIYPSGEPIPLWIQYKRFMVDTLTFHWGESWVIVRERAVSAIILNRMPPTIWLGFWSVVIAIGVGVPVGLYAGLNANTWGDYVSSGGGIMWRAMPSFWLAVIILGLISSGGLLEWYRHFLIDTRAVGTSEAVDHLFNVEPLFSGIPMLEELFIPYPDLYMWAKAFKWILPAALVLGSASMGNEIRIGRTAVLESINSKYIDTAKAKGLPTRTIITKHIGRNAVLPLLPVIMGEFYLLIGGAVLVELVFAIQGLGYLFLQAALAGDIPVIMALVYVFILIQISFNITQDLLYTYIDPRIELESTGG